MARPKLLAVGAVVSALLALPVLAAVALGADPILVRPGDTLTAISERHGVSIERLVQLNAIHDPNRIYVGQRLTLEPVSSDAPAADAPRAGTEHVVHPGESLWGIARHYGSSVEAIASANGLADPSRIFAGQRLLIPVSAGAPSHAPKQPEPAAPAAQTRVPASVTHVVQRGESLWSIAQRYGSSVAAIAAANGLADPSRIFGGQRLVIPDATDRAKASVQALPRDMAAAMEARAGVRRMVEAEARAQGVPVALALAVAWQESGWRQEVTSYAGAVGVMQLLPSTAQWVADSMLGTPVDVHEAGDNIRAGVRLLAHYMDRYGARSDLVLAAYYQGQRAADQHGIYAVSRPYIASIRALERAFGS